MFFQVHHQDQHSQARTGTITTAHGTINTPTFIPVATQATVKALTSAQLQEIGSDALLCNTYHLYLRPGEKTVKKLGGLHTFMNWNKPLFTDSGGFQVFSLNQGQGLCTVTDNGVEFRSHIDQSKHLFTPEKSIQIQRDLGADIIFTFDECLEFNAEYERTKRAMQRTHAWAERGWKEFQRGANEKNKKKVRGTTPRGWSEIPSGVAATRSRDALYCAAVTPDGASPDRRQRSPSPVSLVFRRPPIISPQPLPQKLPEQALYGIVQGGKYKDLRKESAQFISSLPFPGYGIGSIFGEPKEESLAITKLMLQHLPHEKPKHLLGIGSVDDIFNYVELGIDTFDCVLPTRLARVGYIFIRPESGGTVMNKFRYRILNAQFKEEKSPLDRNCGCYVCKSFSRAYIRHLFKAEELLAYTLATYHNLWFFQRMMGEIRESLGKGKWGKMKKEWL